MAFNFNADGFANIKFDNLLGTSEIKSFSPNSKFNVGAFNSLTTKSMSNAVNNQSDNIIKTKVGNFNVENLTPKIENLQPKVDSIATELKKSTEYKKTHLPCQLDKGKLPIVTREKNVTNRIASGEIDKRVALTVAPRTQNLDESLYIDKVTKVLGESSYNNKSINWLLPNAELYGLLRQSLGQSSGIIFPYTPKINFNHKISYSNTSIPQTNLSYNNYTNSDLPTISLSASFTADNRENALHMLAAIWFLRACSKCEFGEYEDDAGLPPPILYLSGYNSTIDNIPVVITSFNVDFPNDKHYVNLVLDLSKEYTSGEFIKTFETDTTATSKLGKALSSKVTRNTGINLSFWLPTSMDFNIGLSVQPNLLKTRKQWSLEKFKSGVLFTNSGKNPKIKSGAKEVTKIVGEEYENDIGLKMCVPKKVTTTENTFLTSIPSGWSW